MSQTNGIAYIYNPDRQTPQELINNFVVRFKEFREVFDDIKSSTMQNPEQHYIIQGPRGSGKTTLLLRIYYEIMNDLNLKKWLIPIIFSEEQYHIRTLCRLWESVVELLEEYEGFTGLSEKFEESYVRDDYQEICFDILSKALHGKRKKLVLFIDNIGDMLDRFSEKEHHQLREILLTSPDIRIVGASSTTLEYTYDYSKPFFDFFKFVNIVGLSPDETNQLLINLSKNYNEEAVLEIIKKQPERVEILRRLTGGIPRTIVLLFEIFADDKSGDSFKDLEIILDRVTPLYKHRMDDLSHQQQEIVDAMALNWDAISVKEIAAKIRMESKAVSSQLKQLEKNRIVHKIETHTKNYLYQISERFFNIWYLMRHGRRKDSNKVLWLVRFLQEWCSREELIDRAKKHIEALSQKDFHAKHAFYMTEALSRTSLPIKLQHELIERTKEFLSRKDKRLLKELSKSDMELLEKAENYFKENNFNQCLQTLDSIRNKESIFHHYALVYHLGLKEYGKAEEYYLKAIEKDDVDALFNLGNLYKEQKEYKKAAEYYLKAIEKDDVGAMLNLGNLYKEQKEYKKAEEYYLKAIERGHAGALFNLGNLYDEQKEYKKAEEYYLKAVEKGNVGAMNNLALLYFGRKEKKDIALENMRNAVAILPDINYRAGLTLCLLWNNKIEEAITEFKKALASWDGSENLNIPIRNCLVYFIAKKQSHFVFQLFEKSPLNLKDRFKPVYYALMYFMQDEYPSEYKKMGEELRETVEEIIEEIIKEIEKVSVDYA